MRVTLIPDEELLQRLPLPLAQLYRRAHNAQTALERHLTAFYLWEASLKLLASTAIVECAERGVEDAGVIERLKQLKRPTLGHWWQFTRLLVPLLADQNDVAFRQVRDLLLGKARDDLPRVAGLDAALREATDGTRGIRAHVRLAELFDRLVNFRNEELGHGAAGQRQKDYYERLGPALLAGMGELLGRLDVLAGRRLIHVADVRLLTSGSWLIERFELTGEIARRLESLEVAGTATGPLPRPGCLYLCGPGPAAGWNSLHPLVLYEADAGRVYFFNARCGSSEAKYLCYTNSDVVTKEQGADPRVLLARVLGGPVDEAPPAEEREVPGRVEEPGPRCRTLGEFELLSCIGSGGMGVVYRAWQPSLGRQVALKCLLRTGDPKAEARFAREIRALGRVDHPHVVKILTSGAEGEWWFYAMDLVEGADLAAVLSHLTTSASTEVDAAAWQRAVSTACDEQRRREKPLTDDFPFRAEATAMPESPARNDEPPALVRPGKGHVEQVVGLIRQAAEAAHALHEAGVIHRDIKPGNVLLAAEGGHAMLMDLGLAQLNDETRGRLTRTGQFVGTLRYASPEQLVGATLDRRADVYSLGATLWELLTLRPLFGITDKTPTPDMILRLQQAEPERVRKYHPGVPADLEAVVLRCLEKDRNRRYATAAELAEDLGRWQRGELVLARLPSLGYLLRKQAWHYRWRVLLAAGALLAVQAGVVFLQVNAALQREKTARNEAEANLLRAEHSERSEHEERERIARTREGILKFLACYRLTAERQLDAESILNARHELRVCGELLKAVFAADREDAVIREQLVETLNSLVWLELLQGSPGLVKDAILDAEYATRHIGEGKHLEIWMNLAHAYLFDGQFEAAEKLYRKYRDHLFPNEEPGGVDPKTFAAVVREDFAVFRARRTQPVPLNDRIERDMKRVEEEILPAK